jgi:hypothetical protein
MREVSVVRWRLNKLWRGRHPVLWSLRRRRRLLLYVLIHLHEWYAEAVVAFDDLEFRSIIADHGIFLESETETIEDEIVVVVCRRYVGNRIDLLTFFNVLEDCLHHVGVY